MKPLRPRSLLLGLLSAGTVGGVVYFMRFPRPSKSLPADADNELFTQSRAEMLARLPTSALLRSLFVHSTCSHPALVDLGLKVISYRKSRPTPLWDTLVRHTFFAHFCGYVWTLLSLEPR
jgi:hypothetical protein